MTVRCSMSLLILLHLRQTFSVEVCVYACIGDLFRNEVEVYSKTRINDGAGHWAIPFTWEALRK